MAVETELSGLAGAAKHAVLLVENESVPTDRRVWGHGRVLADAGYRVTIVCPQGVGPERFLTEERDGISIRRFPLKRAESGVGSYLFEYTIALWRMLRVVLRLPGRIDVIQSANPPDFLFLIGLIPRLRWGTKLVFDHHDLAPELFETKFAGSGLGPKMALALLRLVERANFIVADRVISTNESYRQVAIGRGGLEPASVRIVRNARKVSTFEGAEVDPSLKKGRRFLAVYVGRMGSQDGADDAVRIIAAYRYQLGRDDLHVIMVGDGDARPGCEELAKELGVDDVVEFVGWQDPADVPKYLRSADIGLATDPPGPLNDRSTMIKVIEYLAAGLAVVSYDLPESQITAGDAVLYASGGDEIGFAKKLVDLVDDPELRRELSERALARSAEPDLSWETSRDALLETYRVLESPDV